MKPLVIDTSMWIEWFRGREHAWVPPAKQRPVFMPVPVEMELLAGVKTTKEQRLLESFLTAFVRHNRFILPMRTDFRRAGQLLAESGLPASKHSNDALIAVCARSIGAELWTLNKKDFLPFCRELRVTLGPT